MRYLHTIESTDTADLPAWQAITTGDPEEYDGTAAAYGREVLDRWIYDNGTDGTTDEDGNPLLRAVVAFADDPDAFASSSNIVATITCDQLEEPAPEIVILEAARERKLYVGLLDQLADQELEEALQEARVTGASKNWLAGFVYPAVSRPIALRMMPK
ncbi:hypothetical protein ACWEPB_02855 [Kitasatospora cineracea]